MTEFLWIEFNLQKIDNHNLSPEEVEFAWHQRTDLHERNHPQQGLYMESVGACPSGRMITMIWRYNQVVDREVVFVITAY